MFGDTVLVPKTPTYFNLGESVRDSIHSVNCSVSDFRQKNHNIIFSSSFLFKYFFFCYRLNAFVLQTHVLKPNPQNEGI